MGSSPLGVLCPQHIPCHCWRGEEGRREERRREEGKDGGRGELGSGEGSRIGSFHYPSY